MVEAVQRYSNSEVNILSSLEVITKRVSAQKIALVLSFKSIQFLTESINVRWFTVVYCEVNFVK